MKDGWQLTRRHQARNRRKPAHGYASLNKRGEIVINPQLWRHLHGTYNVTLLFDAASRRIGVKYPVTADGDFFAVRSYGRGRRLKIVRARRLLMQFGIEVKQTIVFDDPKVTRLNGVPMIVLELDKARPLTRPIFATACSNSS